MLYLSIYVYIYIYIYIYINLLTRLHPYSGEPGVWLCRWDYAIASSNTALAKSGRCCVRHVLMESWGGALVAFGGYEVSFRRGLARPHC